MNKLIIRVVPLILGFFFLNRGNVLAQYQTGAMGVGFIAGAPLGFSAKYFMDSKTAVDLALGAQDSHFAAHGDFLIHFSDILPQPRQGLFPVYLGLGMKVKDQRDTLFGIRFVAGLAYKPRNHPLEFFAEIAPVLEMAPDVDSGIDGGVGVRYYFGLPSRKSR